MLTLAIRRGLVLCSTAISGVHTVDTFVFSELRAFCGNSCCIIIIIINQPQPSSASIVSLVFLCSNLHVDVTFHSIDMQMHGL